MRRRTVQKAPTRLCSALAPAGPFQPPFSRPLERAPGAAKRAATDYANPCASLPAQLAHDVLANLFLWRRQRPEPDRGESFSDRRVANASAGRIGGRE